jgi:hypothetical protein
MLADRSRIFFDMDIGFSCEAEMLAKDFLAKSEMLLSRSHPNHAPISATCI